MPRYHWSRQLLAAALAGVVLLQGCVAHTLTVRALPRPPADSTTTVTSPLRVQLLSGEILRFPGGATVTGSTLEGDGTRHDLALHEVAPVTAIPLDSVVAMVHYRGQIDTGKSLRTSGLLVGGLAIAIGLAAVAVGGVGPTIDLGDINWIGY
jgi:hypothetical protein